MFSGTIYSDYVVAKCRLSWTSCARCFNCASKYRELLEALSVPAYTEFPDEVQSSENFNLLAAIFERNATESICPSIMPLTELSDEITSVKS